MKIMNSDNIVMAEFEKELGELVESYPAINIVASFTADNGEIGNLGKTSSLEKACLLLSTLTNAHNMTMVKIMNIK